MIDTTKLAAVLLLASAFSLLVAAMLYPSALLRWFQRKRYQYEVTFSLYMLTSTEKFIFSTFLLPRLLASGRILNPGPLNKTTHRPYPFHILHSLLHSCILPHSQGTVN
jgi:hypothetical protein